MAARPIAALLVEKASTKLSQRVELDVMRPLQAFDAGGGAQTLSAVVNALAKAKEASIDPG